jgi:cell division septation protein DedD
MNDGVSPGKPSGFLLGKEFIIIIVIVFSGLSFTLGYFVGRNTGAEKAGTSLQAAENSASQNSPVNGPETPGAPQAQPVVQANVQAPEPGRTDVASQQTAHAVEPARKDFPNPAAQQKDTGAVSARTAPEKLAAKAEARQPAEEAGPVYTVQLGAFKNLGDARVLKAKLEKNGHKTSIASAKNSKGQKIFKVKTGEFREKKEAEVLALKLKKTEGLQTYVTTRE